MFYFFYDSRLFQLGIEDQIELRSHLEQNYLGINGCLFYIGRRYSRDDAKK